MRDINEILNGSDISVIISDMKNRAYYVPEWDKLVRDYEPDLHKIVDDHIGRVDKVHSDGSKDAAARIPLGLEKLLVKRITEFTFAIPVKRIYTGTDNETRKAIADAIEAIYNNAHIKNENIKRGIAYYASCEILTIWYTVENPNTLYGFNSQFKLKCKTYSPMYGHKLYPLFDEQGDLIAMSFEYEKRQSQDLTTTYFETYTADRHLKWKRDGDSGTWEEVKNDDINILKIPGTYLMRPLPIFHGLQPLREDLEYTLSRNSDIIAYNAAPVLKVSGSIVGEEQKGETRRVYRVTEGGDVSYVSWNQSVDSLKTHVDMLLKYFWMQSQMPDISFENMKSLGDIGYDSRRTLLTDAHLKIGEESGPWIEFLQRESNVIKAFLKKMNKKWENEVDNVQVEHVITPFIIEDEQAQLDYHMKANGGQAVESQEESIMYIGKSKDVQETIRKINEETAQKEAVKASALTSMFSEE